MKRSLLASLSLVLAAGTAGAQGLTMQMSNGWQFAFSGNVNAFAIFTHVGDCSGDAGLTACGGLVSSSDQRNVFRETTGLLPAFATFEAKGKEGNLDLAVHFGFAPQIQNINRVHDVFSTSGANIQAGAQIDMRQVYLTAGGEWGQILAGRELGVFLRQNILTDHTLFGVGLSAGANSGGTTLGHIGTGYIYPNFVPQITYSTPASKPAQFAIGLFSPNVIGAPYTTTKIPRIEAEFSYTGNFGAAASGASDAAPPNKVLFWANGMYQHTDTNEVAGAASVSRVRSSPFLLQSIQAGTVGGSGQSSVDSYGLGGGIKLDLAGFTATGSGYWGKGIGDVLLFNGAVDAAGDERTSYGFLGQAGYAFPNSKWSIIGSYGESDLKLTDEEQAGGGGTDGKTKNASAVGDLTYQWSKSLRWVFEYTWGHSKNTLPNGASEKITSHQGAVGLMLFF